MKRICLDTSAYSHFIRGTPSAVEAITQAREVLLPVVALGELRAGFRRGARAKQNETNLRNFLSEPATMVIDVDDEVASIYAELIDDLRSQGTPIPTNDVWIAALASSEGAIVLTFDKHFEHLRRVASLVLA